MENYIIFPPTKTKTTTNNNSKNIIKFSIFSLKWQNIQTKKTIECTKNISCLNDFMFLYFCYAKIINSAQIIVDKMKQKNFCKILVNYLMILFIFQETMDRENLKRKYAKHVKHLLYKYKNNYNINEI